MISDGLVCVVSGSSERIDRYRCTGAGAIGVVAQNGGREGRVIRRADSSNWTLTRLRIK